MRIVGEWLECDDGETRPTIRAYVRGASNQIHGDDFLIDTGADRSVFAAGLARRLRLPASRPSAEVTLLGVGGDAGFVLVTTGIELSRDDGGTATVRGTFAAFTDPMASDLSILGRDVLDNFDVIISRRRNEVLLLAPNHQYHVSRL